MDASSNFILLVCLILLVLLVLWRLGKTKCPKCSRLTEVESTYSSERVEWFEIISCSKCGHHASRLIRPDKTFEHTLAGEWQTLD